MAHFLQTPVSEKIQAIKIRWGEIFLIFFPYFQSTGACRHGEQTRAKARGVCMPEICYRLEVRGKGKTA